MYELIRRLLCPFEDLAKFLPSEGKILDVGCGHGIFARVLAKNHPERKILGIDPSGAKIKTAEKLAKNYKNVGFKRAYLKEINQKFDAITIIDVLYLLPQDERLKLLKKAKSLLAKDGLLLVKTDSKDPRWLFNILRFEEYLMVKILRFTHSDFGKIYHLGINEYKKLLTGAGFKIVKFKVITSFFPYRHPTYVAKVN
ncbi:MAG: 3-demethylubiquinone-9 3-methyltransferase [Candidatus Woesebacteria bacterium GW2011_GWB1_45_5]|uniref:3-demethylubiquinone-9 3-methyltransferase n=1 Tax=Candidatus Woesebacteria bacterium GW2011_GWB1_45_5 TaxID=1618581 RepID=A0A0G1PZM5_9BACT|nr:MAG: 3-demethylubiquinone-9 3-methyltransferase [Candidatus Woesebacteria bacterium GW2011_GWB1_45_5]